MIATLTRLTVRVLCVALFFMFTIDGAAADDRSAFSIPNSDVHTLTSGTPDRTYDIYIRTPVGYNKPENADRTYPVIYLNDGPYTFQVASGVTHLPMGGPHKLERAILVGISFAHGEGGMDSRVRDLTPVSDDSWQNYETGGGPQYLKFIESEVIQFVETNYRADPKKRTLAGQSLGGSFGAWVLLEHPGIFSSYILTSPSLWYKDRLIFDLEASYAARHHDMKAKVYLAVGELETIAHGMRQPMKPQLEEFGEALSSRNYPGLDLKVEIISDAIHETTFPQGFTRGAQWLFSRD